MSNSVQSASKVELVPGWEYRYDRDRFQAQRWINIQDPIQDTSLGRRCLSHWLSKSMYPIPVHVHLDPSCDETVLIPRNLVQACTAQIGVHVGFIDQGDIPSLSASTTRLGAVCFLTG
jgi:hypothetical protein